MLKTIIAAAVLAIVSTGSAIAGPIIDFSGITAGAQVLDYYNGGTDSTGATGVNYGVRFDGGTIVYDEYGPRLQGSTTMTFASNIVPLNSDGLFNIGFLATIFDVDGDFTYLSNPNFIVDSSFVGGTGNPNCLSLTTQQCIDSGYFYVPPSQMGGYFLTSFGNATSLFFNVDALDNIEFGVSGRPAFRPAFVAEGEVPEPAGIALMGLGLAGLVVSRRRSKVSAQTA